MPITKNIGDTLTVTLTAKDSGTFPTPTNATSPASWDGILSPTTAVVQSPGVTPITYTQRFSCVGPGSVTLIYTDSLSGGTVTHQDTVTVNPPPQTPDFTIVLS